MKSIAVLVLLMSFCAIVQAQTTSIWVTSEPGVLVYLDGQYRGSTTAEFGGIYIQNVTPGKHIIEVRKEGFPPKVEEVTVRLDGLKYPVSFTAPRIKITQQGNTDGQQISAPVGSLTIQSMPWDIIINIPSLDVSNYQKTDYYWKATDCPVGRHIATFKWKNVVFSDEIEIMQNELTHIDVNMQERKVTYIKRPGPAGQMRIETYPISTVKIREKIFGETPITIDNLTPGTYKIVVTAYLDREGYEQNFSVQTDIDVFDKQITTWKYNFYDDFKVGEIEIHSNLIQPLEIELENITFSKKYLKLTSFKGKILTGDYSVKWTDNKPNKLDLHVRENELASIYLPFEEKYLKEFGFEDISDFIDKESYFKLNYKPLPKTKYIKILQCRERGWLAPLIYVPLGAFCLWMGSELEEYKIVGYGLGGLCALLSVTIPFEFGQKEVIIKENVIKNRQNYSKVENEYQILTNSWQEELDRRNKPIKEKNEEIKRSNEKLRPASVNYTLK